MRARQDPPLRNLLSILQEKRCVVNAGLWKGDPDIDAATRLALNPIVTKNLAPNNYSLSLRTKCPFNSQNTALHRDVIPAYCIIHGVGRYDDIIPSYIVKRIADHLGDYVRFGEPIVRQVRNQHDLWKDLEDERIGMQLTDRFVDWLYEITLAGATYKECLEQVIFGLQLRYITADANKTLSPEQYQFLQNITTAYNKWMEVL